jgi:hypothetical protein
VRELQEGWHRCQAIVQRDEEQGFPSAHRQTCWLFDLPENFDMMLQREAQDLEHNSLDWIYAIVHRAHLSGYFFSLKLASRNAI